MTDSERIIKRVHFIGVGGSGVSGLALMAHQQGLQVTGSDSGQSKYLQTLIAAGLDVTVGHDAQLVDDPAIDIVVASTAIPSTNPEVVAANARGLEVWQRARFLAYLARGKKLLAVTGTHGKTTTSSMLACALHALGAEPSFLIGGIVDGFNVTAQLGSGEYFVVEADESDGSFVWFAPELEIITNIEADHMDYYSSIEQIDEAFVSFISNLKAGGHLLYCADDKGAFSLCKRTPTSMSASSYGVSSGSDFEVAITGINSCCVVFADGQEVVLDLPNAAGVHNMLNATAVLAALSLLGFEREAAACALKAYSGVRRRFDQIGEIGKITVVDDYGHHPTEIAATLAAARGLSYEQIHMVFQPHRFTRTKALFDQFACAFGDATTLTIMPIYSAGEMPIDGITSEALASAVKASTPQIRVNCASEPQQIIAQLQATLADSRAAGQRTLIITQGAGSVTNLAPLIFAALEDSDGNK